MSKTDLPEWISQEWTDDPEFVRAYRRARFWRPVTGRFEDACYWIAYQLTYAALWIWDDAVGDASDDWWKAYRKRNGIPEEESDDDEIDVEIAAMSPDELAGEIAVLAGSRPNWPD